MGVTKILPIVFSIILLGAIGSFHEAEAGPGCTIPPLFNPQPLPNISVPATSASGATVTYSFSAIDCTGRTIPVPAGGSLSCTIASGSTFPIGSTPVTCTATNADGLSTMQTFNVIVTDSTPPTITSVPPDVTTEATTTTPPGQAVAIGGPATATDNIDPNPVITNNAPALFPLGITTVTWTATDSSGNTASATQRVTVVDTTPPVITPPGPVTLEGNTIGGHDGTGLVPATATDIADPSPVITNDITTTLPLGTTTVTWTATDSSGNTASATQDVTVVDTTPPTFSLISFTTITDLFSTPESVVFSIVTPPDYNTFITSFGGVSDIVDPNPTIIGNPSPSEYPIGSTLVPTTATDASGNSFTRDVTVTLNPNDADGDGIVGAIDPDSMFSDLIEDLPEGTTGEIITRGAQSALIIYEEPEPDGVRFVNQPMAGDPAILNVCDNAAEITIDNDDSGIVTCGSVEVGIVSGSVEVSFTTGGPPVTSTMTPPDMLLFDPGTLKITNTGTSTATITFMDRIINLLPGQSITIVIPGKTGSVTAQDPNLGDVRHGRGHDNGFCMNQNCINVDGYFTHFPETSVRQGSTQAFSVLVNCPRGANTCNHIEIAGALPDSDFYDYQWAASVDRQPRSDDWVLSTHNPFGEIGDVTVAVQDVGQSFVSATFNIPFLIPGSIGTPDGIGIPHENNRHLHVTVWDNNRGMSNYIFNDGVYVEDIYAYPQVEASYDPPLETEKLCINEDSTKRHTCAFDLVKQWTIKQAQEKLEQIYQENNYQTELE